MAPLKDPEPPVPLPVTNSLAAELQAPMAFEASLFSPLLSPSSVTRLPHPFPEEFCTFWKGYTNALPVEVSGAGRSTPVPSNQPFPTPAEIHAAIPATGITSSDLLRIFRPRIGESKENHRRFIAIVKDVGLYGKEDRLLRPGTWKPTQ